ncbi:activator-dependent family glycosyltransferase [Kitasatospora sp. NPDC091207]|uniref:activator-dependent family glycosyltransferase n=1 Tax=Kitasatospora sp. NPDC091207 TaxID=3364083 RepID=UPI0037FD8095
MRVLFTVMPAAAHLQPVVPLAWALQSAGHDVCVASHPNMADLITAAGLTAVSVGQVDDLGALMRGAADDQVLESITASLRADPEDLNIRNAFRYYQLAAFSLYYPTRPRDHGYRPMVDDLITFARAWRPDLVLWDPLSFPGPIAARACGAAHGRLQYGLDYTAWARQRLAELNSASDGPAVEDLMALAMLPELERLGEEFDEELVQGQWTVDLVPPGMRLPLDLSYVPMRRVSYDGAHVFPTWLRRRPDRPRVCLTLGLSTRKFLAADSAALVGDLLEMAAQTDADFVATLNATQLESVSSVPANVSALDYVPLSLLLPTCSAIVHHGGGGTFASAVAHRVPQMVPAPGEGGDRLAFARYVHERGAGLMLGREEVTVETLHRQMALLLHDPTFRQGTDRLHADMVAMPTPKEVVPVLERLTADHRS